MKLANSNRLSIRLLKWVLSTALLLGFGVSVAQIILDAYRTRENIDSRGHQMLSIVRDPARQAAYSLDREMASQVVVGLFEYPSVRYARVGYSKENALAEKEKPLLVSPYRTLTDWFFGQQQEYSIELTSNQPSKELYGYLTITFDTFNAASDFLHRSLIIMLSGIIHSLSLGILLYLIYQHLITKPLEHLIDNINEINPDQPTKKQIKPLSGHERDELGVWINKTNQLLHSIEQNNTKRLKAEAHVLRLAQYDFLTGLPNRSMVQKQLQRLIDNNPPHRSIAVICCGIDDFKVVNESFSYKMGDQIMIAFADRLRHNKEAIPFVARLGGDQFAIVIDNLSHAYEAAELAQSLSDDLEKPFMIDNREISIKTTIGISLYPEDADQPEKLLQKAEQTMTLAKLNSRHGYQFYVASVDAEIRERKQLGIDLQAAVDNHEFRLFYQPQINFQTNEIIGAEALIRWEHPTKGLIPPDAFIPLAEQTKLIIPIGEWVLETACKQAIEWHEMGFHDFRVSVNLSAVQLDYGAIDQTVLRILQNTGLQAKYLELEVTESSIIEDHHSLADKLNRVKNIGVLIALDDFGTGYSSLTYLKKLPFDKIKIDKDFIRDIFKSEEDSVIVNAIIQLGKTMNLGVIAEGVETQEQEIYLKSHNCLEGQGYFYSKPVAPGKFAEFVNNHNKRKMLV